MRVISRSVLTLALSVPFAFAAAAQDASNYYNIKSVTIIAGSAAGGGVDLYARLVGRHLQKHVPGAPTVIVQNMPGAGSLRAANHVYSVAPKDGSVIGAVPGAALFDPLMAGHDLGVYDPRKFNYLGDANADTLVCVARKDAPVKSYSELFEKEFLVGGSGPGSALWYYPTMERYILGAKFKVVAGYRGSNDLKLALQRNEIQGVCGIFWSSAKLQYPGLQTPDGDVRVLVQHDVISRPELKAAGVPLSIDFSKTNQQRKALSAFLSQGTISRPFVLPPGVAAERVAVMRKAFIATLNDEALRGEASKGRMELTVQRAEDVQKQIDQIYQTPTEILAYLRKGAGSK